MKIKQARKRNIPRKGSWASSANSRTDIFRQLRQSETPLLTIKFVGSTSYEISEKPMSWHSIQQHENDILVAENKAAQAKVVWERKVSSKIKSSIKPYGGK